MVRFQDSDEARQMVGESMGTAIKFTDIGGIGPATAKKIKNVSFNIKGPADVADMSADELSDKAGISRDRAAKAISGGGGNPGVSKRNTSGSVSAAGIKSPVGEFMVELGDVDRARARNDTFSRSEEAIRQDDRKRAPITTDYDKWAANKSGLDFPGVDTPSQNPKVMAKDRKTVDPEDTTLDSRTGSLFTLENNISSTKDTTASFEGVLAGSRSPGRGLTNEAADLAAEELGVDINEPSGVDALADVTFLEREKDGFGEDLIPFGAEESDKTKYEFL